MTLRELAEKKSERPRLKISVGTALPRPSTPPQQSSPSSPDPGDRLLGTENLADVIPMFPPRGPGEEKEWEAASLLPAGNLGMILDSTTQTAWLALSRFGMPPLLLFPLPMLGRLTGEPLSPLPSEPDPYGTSHGEEASDVNAKPSPQQTALNAG